MDINNLQTFLEVAKQESFSAASDKLHLTQPAVSKRIAALEASLETKLFDRIGGQVALTEAGRQLLPRARKVLEEMEDIRRSLSNLSGELGGTLTMGTSHHIGLRRLPPILKQYVSRFPNVSLDIQFLGSELACAEVAKGELELAIVTLPSRPSANLQLVKLWDDPLQFVISKDHPLAARREVTLEELMQYPAVLTTAATYTREVLENVLTPRGLTIKTGLATDYLETLMMMIDVGLGWGLLPETMLGDNRLKILTFPGIEISRQLGAVTHRNRTLSNAAKMMLEISADR
ncbi:MAG: LysR family transcriptional regulator [Sedimenticola sp.]|jgi:DNA-binding transcriptional LysR family regulator|nr:MAG: LysR family transcriptional regulator [Sedimenticola sp.]